MKIFPIVSLALLYSGCASLTGPGLVSEMSREDALRLYNGGISETVWLDRLDTISRNLPMANTKSVQLADGFLFYETEMRADGVWVANVIPPADAPDSLKALAGTLRNVPAETNEVFLSDGVLVFGGLPVSETDLRKKFSEWKTLPPSQRGVWILNVKKSASAAELMAVLPIFEEVEFKVEIQPEK